MFQKCHNNQQNNLYGKHFTIGASAYSRFISDEISEDEEDEKDLIEVRAEDEQINQATKYR